MAQAGKQYPRATFADFRVGDGAGNYYWWPARKNWMIVAGGHGDLMTKWIGYHSLSEVCERKDTLCLEWTCRHPSVTADDPYFLLRWKPWVPMTLFNMRWEVEYWEQGIKWGWCQSAGGEGEGTYANGMTWDISGLGVTWQDIVDADEFSDIGYSDVHSGIKVASWPDNAPYQPYRTRP